MLAVWTVDWDVWHGVQTKNLWFSWQVWAKFSSTINTAQRKIHKKPGNVMHAYNLWINEALCLRLNQGLCKNSKTFLSFRLCYIFEHRWARVYKDHVYTSSKNQGYWYACMHATWTPKEKLLSVTSAVLFLVLIGLLIVWLCNLWLALQWKSELLRFFFQGKKRSSWWWRILIPFPSSLATLRSLVKVCLLLHAVSFSTFVFLVDHVLKSKNSRSLQIIMNT